MTIPTNGEELNNTSATVAADVKSPHHLQSVFPVPKVGKFGAHSNFLLLIDDDSMFCHDVGDVLLCYFGSTTTGTLVCAPISSHYPFLL